MLVKNITAEHVFLACGHTDMRKSIDGLAAIVQQNFKLNPFSQDVFMFCGRRKDRIKALFWDGDGFSLLYKRLDNGKFRWPQSKNEAISISEQQLRWLMEGLEIIQQTSVKKSYPTHTI
ncbi:IS66 family insertion sequence element accessory protein TnpB [Selenomonas sp. AE3005]|uniref:IS66 family insertion sequence element accessory protein TnpB n=1 Tax=Selenomonas sp. AE3005 TaxID=1485543 RepID=UPI00048891C6|nr:IS66 family insertion sequence element accessory protein TnpB [Selenomonas sp. AE3005]